jgi:hypothetical protein
MGCADWVERRLLRAKWAPAVAVVLLVLSLNSSLLFFAQVLHKSNAKDGLNPSSVLKINIIGEDLDDSADHVDWKDNLVGKSFFNYMSYPPTDIVYTWVNGSDPRQITGASKAVQGEVTRREKLQKSTRNILFFVPFRPIAQNDPRF